MGYPTASSEHVKERMERQRARDTRPELEIRGALRQRGIRGYRVDWRLPFDRRRRADVAWPGRRVAVFVDGCFWHQCPRHWVAPKSNAQWWQDKIAGNVARDRDTDHRLADLGWVVVRAWEHEIPSAVASRVSEELHRLTGR